MAGGHTTGRDPRILPMGNFLRKTVVVQQPVVVQRQPVWFEGRYVDPVQANGSTVRIWQPGDYE